MDRGGLESALATRQESVPHGRIHGIGSRVPAALGPVQEVGVERDFESRLDGGDDRGAEKRWSLRVRIGSVFRRYREGLFDPISPPTFCPVECLIDLGEKRVRFFFGIVKSDTNTDGQVDGVLFSIETKLFGGTPNSLCDLQSNIE